MTDFHVACREETKSIIQHINLHDDGVSHVYSRIWNLSELKSHHSKLNPNEMKCSLIVASLSKTTYHGSMVVQRNYLVPFRWLKLILNCKTINSLVISLLSTNTCLYLQGRTVNSFQYLGQRHTKLLCNVQPCHSLLFIDSATRNKT